MYLSIYASDMLIISIYLNQYPASIRFLEKASLRMFLFSLLLFDGFWGETPGQVSVLGRATHRAPGGWLLEVPNESGRVLHRAIGVLGVVET